MTQVEEHAAIELPSQSTQSFGSCGLRDGQLKAHINFRAPWVWGLEVHHLSSATLQLLTRHAVLTVFQGSWCSPPPLNRCTADRWHHTGGTFHGDSYTPLQAESNRKACSSSFWYCFNHCILGLYWLYALFYLSAGFVMIAQFFRSHLWAGIVFMSLMIQLIILIAYKRISSVKCYGWYLSLLFITNLYSTGSKGILVLGV